MAEVQITFQDTNIGSKVIKQISFAGQLDETNVDAEAKKIYQVIEEMAEPNLILDFAELEYMNSKSIGYVTDWYSKIMSKNGKLVIARPRVNILDILKVVGITQIVTIFDNLEEAKATFTEEATTPTTIPSPVAEVAPTTTPSVAETTSVPIETPKEPEMATTTTANSSPVNEEVPVTEIPPTV